MFKKKILIVALLLLPAFASADLTVIVQGSKNWGNAPVSNIKRLCTNVTDHFQKHLRNEYKVDGRITIVHKPGTPIVWYNDYLGLPEGQYRIGLAVTGTYWSQMSYQFAHEFCHILHNYNDSRFDDKNQWFQEGICELSTVWVLQEMAKSWANHPPYNNWRDYRFALEGYANEILLGQSGAQYNGTSTEWLDKYEDDMREQKQGVYRYDRICQLTYKFLPVFQEHPEAWNAVRQMPVSNSKMKDYMREWYDTVDDQDKEYVKQIADIMGITVTEPMIATIEIDADVNKDGYIDLYDVMIVRSGINGETSYDTDINNDGITDEADLLIVKMAAMEAIIAASPRKRKIKLTTWGRLKTQ